MRSDDLHSIPSDVAVPGDDGACDHLIGLQLPALALPSTSGQPVHLDALDRWPDLYAYPRTGRPNEEPPGGVTEWNAIPGARGCTPQSCGYRDHHAELAARGARVFGLSTQDTEDQREAAQRLHLPFPLLSDAQLQLAGALRLPTLGHHGRTLLRRLTLIARARRIEHVTYPVFPPDAAAQATLDWLARCR